MKVATWNVNSLNVRLPQVLEWLAAAQPDILALQETKLVDDKFPHAEIRRHPDLVVLGDFNIAPEERDVHDPVLWQGRIMFSDAEREAFRRLLDTGLVDTFRLFDQVPGQFTWWDYRMGAFRRNFGLRIDHVLASQSMARRCRACAIDKAPRNNERPSDHAPVMAEFG